jgi:prephenate dehydratase
LTVAYLGPTGTFTEQAMLSQADVAAGVRLPLAKFADVLDAVSNGEADLGFVAIENAIEGTVNMTLDALAFDHELLIQREVLLDVHLNLMAQPGVTREQIRAVRSHPVANAQCRAFLNKELPDAVVEPANSTSDAAATAADDPTVAAIGPALAAQHHGLDLLAEDIADHSGNKTRFVMVAPQGIPARTGHDKTTVVLTQREDKPGSLVAILQEFAARSINLSSLTSRPVKTSFGNYCFIVDMNGHIGDELIADGLRSIRAKHAEVKFLGSYPAAGDGATETRRDATTAWAEAEAWLADIRTQITD